MHSQAGLVAVANGGVKAGRTSPVDQSACSTPKIQVINTEVPSAPLTRYLNWFVDGWRHPTKSSLHPRCSPQNSWIWHTARTEKQGEENDKDVWPLGGRENDIDAWPHLHGMGMKLYCYYFPLCCGLCEDWMSASFLYLNCPLSSSMNYIVIAFCSLTSP